MGRKSFLKQTKEEQGKIPGCTGALLEITGVEPGKTGEQSKTPGCLKYIVSFKILEPKSLAGMTIRDNRIIIGTEDDPKAKNEETWQRTEGGPGRLVRLLRRTGTPIAEDDEEWMEALVGSQVVAPIEEGRDQFPSSPGLYFRPSDDDCPEIGLDTGEKRGAKGGGKGAAAANKKARAKKPVEADEDDEAGDEEEEPKKPSKKKVDEEDDGEDEDEPQPKKAQGKSGKKAPPPDEDEDEDDD